MTIKMIAVDMDGTFLNDQKEYNIFRFNQLFKVLQEKNIKFVVASGNQYFQLRNFFPDLYKSITFVAENGANIVLGDKAFYNAELDYKTILKTLELLDKLQPTNLIVCGKNSAYVSESISTEAFNSAQFYYPKIKKIKNLFEIENEKDAIFKFALSFDEKNAHGNLLLLQDALENNLVPVSSGHGDIDLIIPGIHKLHGLRLLGKEWNIKDDEMATFGDSGNDIEMIQQVKHSFAMNNAQQNIKDAATTIIGSNNSEAVLDTIQSILEV
ncbi:Cof-type HAD-IIB family hydrolase [Enterococcus sp. AZ136]|uniref:Cof-type HAD-IIB family hydrolase n=1 Tax=Enterococcus sp. AZ136 TaxID=2774788 RepID=UPI003D2CC61B